MFQKIKEGIKVQLYPGDAYSKFAKILSITDKGFEFEMTEGTDPKSNYEPGDIVFINHSTGLRFKIIK